MKQKKIMILGAGPAGLMAAYKLLKSNKNYEVIILEKETDIGGLSKTISFSKNLIDYGVHFYRISEYEEVNDIIYQLMPIQDTDCTELSPNNREKYMMNNQNKNNSDEVMLVNKATSNIYFNKKFYDYPIKLNFDTIHKMGFINLFKIGFSYLPVLIHKKDETNLENYYINRYGKKFYEMFFLEYTKKICGVHPKDIDIDWGKQRIRDTSLINILKEKIFKKKMVSNEPSLINEYYYPKYGCGKMYERLASEVIRLGGKILTDSYPTKIKIKDKQIDYIEYKEKGRLKKLSVDYLINSIPLKNFISLIDDQEIDSNIVRKIKSLPFRDLMLVNLVFSKKEMLKLKNYQIIKDNCWVFIQDPKIKFGRLKICNNWSTYMIEDEDKLLIALEYCYDANEKFAKLKDREIIQEVEKELKYLYLFPESGIEKYKIDRVKNAYPAYYGAYKERPMMILALDKYEQIYFIGRGGQHQYIDMDKAMYTAIKASEDIIEGRHDKKDVWLV